VRAPQPEPPIPGSFATPSLLAWIVNGKYVMSLPLYRIETDLKACGATISRQDMANWMMNVHARWLAKVHERMKVELLSHVRIHADETTVQVLKEPNREAKKKSRMWLFCSARCNVPVYVFEYHETRRKGVAQEFLAGWSGTLTANGYKPYFNLGCLCSISCCGFSHDDFSGLGRACRPRNGLNWMVLVSPPERTGKDYDQHAPSTVYPSFAAERGIRRVDRAENTCRRSRRCVSTSRRRICRPCRR
ncbi:Transposase IS66 family protein, partial [Bifidobacterium longum subsp. longum]